MELIFIEFTLVIVCATIFSILFRLLKQPSIVAYIIVGTLLGPLVFGTISSTEFYRFFGEIGVAILLFITGLHLKVRELFIENKTAIKLGFIQFLLLSFIFLPIFYFLYNNLNTALLLSMFTTFASTIISTKLLSDNRELDTLHGKLSIGILIFQDILAAIFIFFITLNNFNPIGILLIFVLLMLFSNKKVNKQFSRLIYYLAKFPEILFLFSISWIMLIGMLFLYAGLSLELGALVAGMILANIEYKEEIESRLKPLREFFLLFFFVYLGANITTVPSFDKILLLFVLAFLIVLIKAIVTFFIFRKFKYSVITSKYIGLYLSSCSEFAFILAYLSVNFGIISCDLSNYYILLVLSILISVYLVQMKKIIKKNLHRIFKIKLTEIEEALSKYDKSKSYEIILIGCDRTGSKLAWKIKEMGLLDKLLIIDINPEIVKKLKEEGYNVVYADASDIYFLESLNLEKTKLVISTIPSVEENQTILKFIKLRNPEIKVVLVAQDIKEAISLYRNGADFVILPYFLAAEFLAESLESLFDKQFLEFMRHKHFEDLIKRLTYGHKHPKKL